MATSIKITQTFDIVAASGESYHVEEHTRCSTAMVNGVKRMEQGRTFLKTNEGRGVLKNIDNDTYSIPSLGIKAARRQV